MPDDNNAVRKLAATNPGLELWWDSSPLVYDAWTKGPGKEFKDTGLFQVSDADDDSDDGIFQEESLLQGCTTNQPLVWQAIEEDPERWAKWLKNQLDATPGLDVQEAMWRLYIQPAVLGADMLEPIFLGSNKRWGQICCQVDPRNLTDTETMLLQARRIHSARPNIMIKMPATKEGIDGVRILASEGIPTTVTLGFTLSQLIAVGEAVEKGLKTARKQGTDLSRWRCCAVMMLGRFEDAPQLKNQANSLGIEITEADLRWAGIAIFRKAHMLYKKRGYASKLMAASMRLGPTIEGVQCIWHLEKLAGADAVLTIFPNIFEAFISTYKDIPIESRIEEPIPREVMEKLLRIPYFVEAYNERGIKPENFINHPALQATAAGFTEAMENVERFAADTINLAGEKHGDN
ncbi:MAG: transaldolase family protein [Spirochaetales bacterium]|nr:transaldolase family protein [Spirochaetales bacterium]